MSQIRANTIVNEANNGSPTFPFGISGITTSTNAQTAAYAEVAGIATNATNATNAEGLTGSPDITVGNIVAADGTFSGDVSVAGTITYEDVTSVRCHWYYHCNIRVLMLLVVASMLLVL